MIIKFQQYLIYFCNIGIVVYIDVGKIIIIECILFFMGCICNLGEIYEGVLQMDWMEQECECGIIIIVVVIIVYWIYIEIGEDYIVNIIDIFGYVDFIIEVECFMCVFDGVVVVFDFSQGVELQSEIVWCQVDCYGVFCVVFVNKMDKIGVSFDFVVNDICECFGVIFVFIQYFMGVENDFKGVIDIVWMQVYIFINDFGIEIQVGDVFVEYMDKVNEMCQQLIEVVVEVDEDLMMKFFEGEEFIQQEFIVVICKGIIDKQIFLVLCGSVLKNKGVQLFFDVVVDYLFSLFEVLFIKGIYEDGEIVIEFFVDFEGKFVVLVFKIMVDFYVGCLIFVCIYLGILILGSYVYNVFKDKCECVGCLLKMYVNSCEEVIEFKVGEFGVVIGFKDVGIGNILIGDGDDCVLFEFIDIFEFVIKFVIEFKIKVDQEKMGVGFQKFVEEDFIFKVEIDQESGQMIIVGMGELYLEILVDCLKCEYKVEVNVGVLQVVYCEIIIKQVEVDSKFVCQLGGCGQYGYVKLCVEFFEFGVGFIFENVVVGGIVFKEYIGLVQKGVEEVMQSGFMFGFFVVDIKVVIYDGLYYEVDFSEMVFKIVGLMGFKEVVQKGSFVIFEFVMCVEVIIFEEYMGDVIGDLNSCCGQIQGMEVCGNVQIVKVFVLFLEMFGYVIDMCFKIQGCVSYLMFFDYYIQVFINLVQQLMKK